MGAGGSSSPCVSFFLFSAGCTNEAKARSENKIVNRISNTITQENKTSIANIVSNINNIRWNIPGGINCAGGINFQQKIDAKVTAINNIDSNQAASIKNDLKETLKQDVASLAKNDPNLWQSLFGKSANQSSITEVQNFLSTEFDNKVSSSVISNAVNSVINANENIINAGSISSERECNAGQDIVANIQLSNIVRNVQSSLLNSNIFREIDQKIKASAETGGGSSRLLTILLLVLGILVVLGVVGFVLTRPKGQAAYPFPFLPPPMMPPPPAGYGMGYPPPPSPYPPGGYAFRPPPPSPYPPGAYAFRPPPPTTVLPSYEAARRYGPSPAPPQPAFGLPSYESTVQAPGYSRNLPPSNVPPQPPQGYGNRPPAYQQPYNPGIAWR